MVQVDIIFTYLLLYFGIVCEATLTSWVSILT